MTVQEDIFIVVDHQDNCLTESKCGAMGNKGSSSATKRRCGKQHNESKTQPAPKVVAVSANPLPIISVVSRQHEGPSTPTTSDLLRKDRQGLNAALEQTSTTRMYALYLLPLAFGSFVGFCLSTWVRMKLGVWSIYPIAIIQNLYSGEEGHKAPGYDKIMTWHCLFAFVWMFVCLHQIATASVGTLTIARLARRAHVFAGRYVGPISLFGMTPFWVAAIWYNTDYVGGVKVIAYMVVGFDSVCILLNAVFGMQCLLDPRVKRLYANKQQAIADHKIYMFFAFKWSMLPGYDRVNMALVQFLYPSCFTGFKGVAIGSFASNIQMEIGSFVIMWLCGTLWDKIHLYNLGVGWFHVVFMFVLILLNNEGAECFA
jgi:ABC-type Co2+ transport system permease subunit